MEKVEVIIKPEGLAYTHAYKVTFESPAPSAMAAHLARDIAKLLREEYVAAGVENIKTDL